MNANGDMVYIEINYVESYDYLQGNVVEKQFLTLFPLKCMKKAKKTFFLSTINYIYRIDH